jgi:hypothetical protein
VTILPDSTGAVALIRNRVHHSWAKNNDFQHKFVRVQGGGKAYMLPNSGNHSTCTDEIIVC